MIVWLSVAILQPLCYAKGMTKYLYTHQIRIFDYTQFAEPMRDLDSGECAEHCRRKWARNRIHQQER